MVDAPLLTRNTLIHNIEKYTMLVMINLVIPNYQRVQFALVFLPDYFKIFSKLGKISLVLKMTVDMFKSEGFKVHV